MRYYTDDPNDLPFPRHLENVPGRLVGRLIGQSIVQIDPVAKKWQHGGIVRVLSLSIIEKNVITLRKECNTFQLKEQVTTGDKVTEKTVLTFFAQEFLPAKGVELGYRIYPIRVIRFQKGVNTYDLEAVKYKEGEPIHDVDPANSMELCKFVNHWVREMPREEYFGSSHKHDG